MNMKLYDDKTKNAINNGMQLLLPVVDANEDIIFKASYVIAGDLQCSGKVSALFDLIVLGDASAKEIDVKGRFVCMGHCTVNGAIIVQNDIWGEDLRADSITCRDHIVAQSIDVDTIISDGNIIIGKTLAIEEKAQTSQKVICGETAYGAGKIAASCILTAEPLDLDDGEDALESPFQYAPQVASKGIFGVSVGSVEYSLSNDYIGFISELKKISDATAQKDLERYLTVLRVVDKAFQNSISEFRDVAILIWLLEISNSAYFKGWPKILEWTECILVHYKDMVEGKISSLHEPQPATKLEKGYTVLHKKFGKGVVRSILQTSINGKNSRMVIVHFELYGEKKFPLPDSLKFFSIISEGQVTSTEEINATIQCNISSYSEWVLSLQIVERYKDKLGINLYSIMQDLLLAKIGLKSKFIEDRIKEKGWS